MRQALLTLNSGSSSLKFSLFAITKQALHSPFICRGQIENLNTTPQFIVKDHKGEVLVKQEDIALLKNNKQQTVLGCILHWLNEYLGEDSKIAAVGHRVVHGGNEFFQPVRINEKILQLLESYNALAPQHQPGNIAGIRFVTELLPDALQVACFDTAFHATQPEIAQAFALPENISPRPIKRYGFHGLSYEYIRDAMSDYIGKMLPEEKTIVAHLGYGASLCAMQNRLSVATTMGFTVLDGLMMATRCGSLDPGVILYLLEQEKMSAESVRQLLYNQSGLLGVSGISSDLSLLLQSDQPKAKKAVELFIYRIAREMGGLINILGGLDYLIFTAGIGEHLAEIRLSVCQYLSWLGVKIDHKANSANALKISTADSKISVWVIPANEEFMIAKHTWQIWRR